LDYAINEPRHKKLPFIKYYEKQRTKYIKSTLEVELQAYMDVFSDQEKEYLLNECPNLESNNLTDRVEDLNKCIEMAKEMYKYHPQGEIAEELKEKYKEHSYFKK
jgi:hypothetical protein